MSDNSKKTNGSSGNFFATLWRWIRRMVLGPSAEMKEMDIFEVEKLESPSRMAVKVFFRRKLAVGALCVLIFLFILVFVGPLFKPMDINFTDPDQANVKPINNLRAIPAAVKNQVKMIHGFGNFTVAVGQDQKLYIWGNSENAMTRIDYAAFPEEVKNGKVYEAAAGYDHVIAVVINPDDPTKGHLVIWGDKNNGQYGYNTGNPTDPVLELPKEIREGDLELSKIGHLNAGKQVSSLVYDGKLYLWGNTNTIQNLVRLQEISADAESPFVKAVFTNYYVIALCEDGTVVAPSSLAPTIFRDEEGTSLYDGEDTDVLQFISRHTIVDIAASKNCFAFLADDGDFVVQGASKYNEMDLPDVPEDEQAISLEGGSLHFGVVTDAGKVYLWGCRDQGQCRLNKKSGDKLFLGAYQTYVLNENGAVKASCGLKGYPFGTDGLGRDTWTRIIHGGKMTMTVGAVAVIISSIIAIIVGCVSGYFGGWVDMLLMRVTEIFAAIPFLPFAMMLSYILTTKPLRETTRIFIIMCILGLLSWTGLAHMVRGQVLAEREKEFVLAAKAMGIKERHIAFRHILPNVISVILVSMTLNFAGCLLTESSLSYLGFGVQQPRPTWGNMLNGANNSLVIQNYWWQWVFPALFLAIATICINIIGDTLRDVLDPKSSREK